MSASETYTVELYDDSLGNQWVNQCITCSSYEECEQYIETHTVEEPYYYSIWCVEYDEHEKEIANYPIY